MVLLRLSCWFDSGRGDVSTTLVYQGFFICTFVIKCADAFSHDSIYCLIHFKAFVARNVKLTKIHIDRIGIFPLVSCLYTVGTISRTVEDAVAVYQFLSVKTDGLAELEELKAVALRGKRIGLVKSDHELTSNCRLLRGRLKSRFLSGWWRGSLKG